VYRISKLKERPRPNKRAVESNEEGGVTTPQMNAGLYNRKRIVLDDVKLELPTCDSRGLKCLFLSRGPLSMFHYLINAGESLLHM
jgi:hypothetical protein